ncbi:class I SAM-dependent methyltransferase [Azotobacter vinelandii]|uniref:class I SAM-dependent methyltransferase n=1 Tax=Azotobacter vinelandii TaxID=354 RepID=UPI00077334BC|nr:class I SAM-dependent methyltransferase [Azotobacter vinelandii]WKN20941.1 class I SAM-dependent methyltransferase [Azotobacter vinelandii]
MTTAEMRIQAPEAVETIDEAELYLKLLPLACARIVELGCGAAKHTRTIAEQGRPASILACEVDSIQHEKNLTIDDLPTVTFVPAGAQAIPVEDGGADIVLMFKSLHHVPVGDMDGALREIRRVLRPGGLAYVSEPIFAGEFNEVVRLFHDERAVREAAFAAVRRAVEQDVLELAGQYFFNTRNDFQDFAEFERRIVGATHTRHELSPELRERVRETFERHMGPDGAHFVMPMRVDLLRRPA